MSSKACDSKCPPFVEQQAQLCQATDDQIVQPPGLFLKALLPSWLTYPVWMHVQGSWPECPPTWPKHVRQPLGPRGANGQRSAVVMVIQATLSFDDEGERVELPELPQSSAQPPDGADDSKPYFYQWNICIQSTFNVKMRKTGQVTYNKTYYF